MDLAGTSVLVTGGAGFIGSHLVEALLAAGSRVRVLDNLSSGSLQNLDPRAARLEIVEGDIRDLATCLEACRGVELVFHQAALTSVSRSIEDPATTISVNALGSIHLFQAARETGVRRTVYASSSSVYGDGPDLPKREGREGAPLSPYALSKKMVEEEARIFALCYRQELVGLRYFNVYGPRQNPAGEYAAVIPSFFTALLAGESPKIYGDGEQSRDFTHVEDAVRANLLAAAAPVSRLAEPLFNIAAGRQTTINELAALIGGLTGAESSPVHLKDRAGDVRHSVADIERAERALDYRPSVSLARGLERTAAYYRLLADKRPVSSTPA